MATRSPSFTDVTSLPMASTIPQPSCPSAPGAIGYLNHSRPSHGGIFEAHTPQPSSFTRTSFAFGVGSGTSSTSIFPGAVMMVAAIVRTVGAVAVNELIVAPPSAPPARPRHHSYEPIRARHLRPGDADEFLVGEPRCRAAIHRGDARLLSRQPSA